jgi:hypothetical protein
MHQIRLRGPWAVTALPDGRTRHARKFGAPPALDPAERVWVTCGFVPGPAAVAVNGHPVGDADGGAAFAFDITSLLNPRNELTIDVAAPGELGEVALEFRPAG